MPKINRYQLSTAHGVLPTLFHTDDLLCVPEPIADSLITTHTFVEDPSITITLHGAAARNSITTRVAILCSCRISCSTNRCSCFKNDIECSIACHTINNLECGNLITLTQYTEVQDIEHSVRPGRKRAASRAIAPVMKAKKAKEIRASRYGKV